MILMREMKRNKMMLVVVLAGTGYSQSMTLNPKFWRNLHREKPRTTEGGKDSTDEDSDSDNPQCEGTGEDQEESEAEEDRSQEKEAETLVVY